MDILMNENRTELSRRIAEISGAEVMKCYQCGKCSAGCPMVEYMDIMPNQVVRLAQLGRFEEIAESNTPWVCAACLTCSVRCPRGIRIAEIVEAVRQIMLRKKDSLRRLEISPEAREELPPIALISAYRKIAE